MKYIIEVPLGHYRYEYKQISRQTAVLWIGEDGLKILEDNKTAREMGGKVMLDTRDEDGNIVRVGIDYSEPEPELKLRLRREEVRDLILACGVFYGQADKWGRLIGKLDRAVKEYDALTDD